jgi:hypothetical protein
MKKVLVISLLLSSCSPVKRVLNNKEMFDKVTEAVIRSGACVTDTITIVTTKDVVVYKDSIIEKEVKVPCKDFDTTFADGTHIKISSGVLTYKVNCPQEIVTTTVTKTNNIRDIKYENILKGDIAIRDSKITADAKLYIAKTEEVSALKKDKRVLKLKLLGLLLLALTVIFRKAIFKL